MQFLESTALFNLIQTRNHHNLTSAFSEAENLYDLYQKFDEHIVSELGPMAIYWNSCISMIQILLDFIKSTRIGYWALHLQASERMLKWFFAYDRTNYSCHFTYYWASQMQLHESHPEILEQFVNGNFAVKRTDGSFNMLPPDQCIEQAINKEQKGAGGIIGISTSAGAVQRWILSSHVTARIYGDLKSSINLKQKGSKPKDVGIKRMRTDENAVKTV